jgi:hydroxyethylthiazole kinase
MPETDPLKTWEALRSVRAQAPLVHNITNYVVMNTTANALLALGASPVMAHAEEEVAEMVGIASALVVNIGTLSERWIAAMRLAVAAAARRGIPIVLDPVGAGATAYRTRTVLELLELAPPTILRGNGSEILSICGAQGRTRGVDSAAASQDAVQAARDLHARLGSVVCISGATDFIVGPPGVYRVENGHPMMTRVTGLGCTASALCGAFAAVTREPALATAQAMAVMGVAGELAAERAEGPGSLQVHFLDALYRLTEADLSARLKVGVGK